MSEHPLGRRIVERPSIVLVDDAVAVLIDVHREIGALTRREDRLAVRAELVLVHVEGIDRHAGLKDLNPGSHATRDTPDENPLRTAGKGVDGDQLIAVARGGEIRGPAEPTPSR